MIKKCGSVSLLVFTTAASGLALADCPNSMPEQLLEDCIVSEGAGNSFPPSDYAHMDQYQAWIKTQQEDHPKALAKQKI